MVIILAIITSRYAFFPQEQPRAASAGSYNEVGPVIHTPTPTPTATPVNNTPVRIMIPAIALDASVEPIGILVNGDLATPTQSPWENTGWYDAGPRPGERGSAVIDGHLDRPGGAPAVFWNLRDLHIGDDVMVVAASGAVLHFRVTRSAFYPPQDAPVQDIFTNNTGTYLNLMTCAGYWVPSEHQTTLRLVVYTTLVDNIQRG